ncbi:ribonuclease H, partial [Trifolium pratense]
EADVAPYRVQQTQYEEELVILYVDGSHKPDIPLAACGGFLCNTSGKWICGFTQKLDPNLRLDQVEKQAILTGLLWVQGMGKRNVLVKSDREEAVKSVNNPVISKSTKDDPLICDIKKVLDSPHWKCKPELIPILRDENKVADKLAKKAHNFTSFNLQHFGGRKKKNLYCCYARCTFLVNFCISKLQYIFMTKGNQLFAAAATAAVAGSLYSILQQPEADVAPYRVQQTHHHHHEEEEEVVIYSKLTVHFCLKFHQQVVVDI